MQAQLGWVAAGVVLAIGAAACGPLPPAVDPTDGTTTSSGTSGESTGEPTTGTTSPPPECAEDSDCGGYCSYCVEGSCEEFVGCCGLMPGPGGELELRCIGYDCYGDEDCEENYVCDINFCVPAPRIPACERQVLALSTIELPGEPGAIALVDLDGDTSLDLVAALPGSGEVAVALGDGAGGFMPPALVPTELEPGPQWIASGDLDLDGDPDLAILRPAPVGELSLLFGQDAVFAKPVLETIGENPQALWIGDIDGDGSPDVLTLDQPAGTRFSLRRGDGLGGLGPAEGQLVAYPEITGAALGQGELPGLELVVTIADAPGLERFGFMGTYEFVKSHAATGQTPHGAVLLAAIDLDLSLEVVGSRSANGATRIDVWRGSDDTRRDAVIDGAATLAGAGDVDGDGPGDVVVLDGGADLAYVLFGDAGAGLDCVQTFELAGPTAPELLATGDIDGDGKADIVAGTGGTQVSVLRSGP